MPSRSLHDKKPFEIIIKGAVINLLNRSAVVYAEQEARIQHPSTR